LEEKLNLICKYIELCSLSSQSNQFTEGSQASTSTQLLETQATTQEIKESPSQVINSSDVLNEPGDPPPIQQNLPIDNILSLPPNPQPSTASIPPQNICRIPKLSLSVFAGNPLQWQSFWDSFDAPVHNNPSLNGIQRFNHLKAQLVGEALQTIAGFPLTNSNYDQAIKLLRDRFGQPHNIVNAHMQALLEIPPPSEHLDSFLSFYDILETHIRRLACLGKSQESYGDLLIPIVLGKLPTEFRKKISSGAWDSRLDN
jgi:hypothetical protein